jgi:Pyridoxamine 5'-phosphate oxidase
MYARLLKIEKRKFLAKFYEQLDDNLRTFIGEQHLFFVATAPLEEGRINLSPKGVDTLRVLNERQVAYLDLTGSGNETAAHLHQNGRLTIMFCSFGTKPLILRLYGRGQVIRPQHPRWAELAPQLPSVAGARQIILLDIESVNTSCGFGIPLYTYKSERKTLVKLAEHEGEEAMEAYRQANNQLSIDGLSTGL